MGQYQLIRQARTLCQTIFLFRAQLRTARVPPHLAPVYGSRKTALGTRYWAITDESVREWGLLPRPIENELANMGTFRAIGKISVAQRNKGEHAESHSQWNGDSRGHQAAQHIVADA